MPVYASTTTLRRIRDARPCEGGWRKLLAHLGKTGADDDPLPLGSVLDSNGLDDALWVLSRAMPDDRLARHFRAWCAEQVLHLFEAARPGDSRVRDQIAMLRRDDATRHERAAAWAAAGDAASAAAMAAASDAAWVLARAAAWPDAGDAASTAAMAATSDAAWVLASDAARAAARDAASDAARDAAGAAAWDAASDAQEKQLRHMLTQEG